MSGPFGARRKHYTYQGENKGEFGIDRIKRKILVHHALSTNRQEQIVPLCSHRQFAHGGADAILGIFPVERNQHPRHGHRLGIDEI